MWLREIESFCESNLLECEVGRRRLGGFLGD